MMMKKLLCSLLITTTAFTCAKEASTKTTTLETKKQKATTCIAPEIKAALEDSLDRKTSEIQQLKADLSALTSKLAFATSQQEKAKNQKQQVTLEAVYDTLLQKSSDTIHDLKSIDWDAKQTEAKVAASKLYGATRQLSLEYGTKANVWMNKTSKAMAPHVATGHRLLTAAVVTGKQHLDTAFNAGKEVYMAHMDPMVRPLVAQAQAKVEPYVTQVATHPMVKANMVLAHDTAAHVSTFAQASMKQAGTSAKASRKVFIATLMKQDHPMLKTNAHMIVDAIITILLLPAVLFMAYYAFQLAWAILLNAIGLACCCFCCGCARKRTTSSVADKDVKLTEKNKTAAKSKGGNNKSNKSNKKRN